MSKNKEKIIYESDKILIKSLENISCNTCSKENAKYYIWDNHEISLQCLSCLYERYYVPQNIKHFILRED